MLVISRIWKQFYVDPLPGSTQNWGNRMEKARGLFMELSSCNKLALDAGGCGGVTAGTWWQALESQRHCDGRECHLWNSFEQLMDGFIVCAAQSRVAWQGAASPSPPQAWVSGYFVHKLWKSLSRSWLCRKREWWGASASHQVGTQQFQLQFGLVLCFLGVYRNSLRALSQREENLPISSVHSLCT